MPAAEPTPPLFSEDEIKELFAPVAREAHVALAVSGGSDSMALVHLAHRWTQQHGRAGESVPKLTILTVDHRLRPGSAAEAQTVGEWAKELELDQVILPWEEDKPLSGLQMIAREARYRLMSEWCRTHSVKVLILAHNLDDQAETVLMRLKRGAGVEGLGGIRPATSRDGIIIFRPLLGMPRARLRAYLGALGRQWLEDPSNQDQRFERVRMRKALGEVGVEAAAIALSAKRVRRAFEAVLNAAYAFLDSEVSQHEEGFGEIALAALLAMSEEIRIRALWSLVRRYGDRGFVEMSEIENLSKWLDSNAGAARTLGGCRIARGKSSLVFGREAGRISPQPVPVPHSGRLKWDNRFEIEASGTLTPTAIAPARLAGKIARQPKLPAFVQASLPAVLVEGRLAAIPHLGLRTEAAPAGLVIRASFSVEPWF